MLASGLWRKLPANDDTDWLMLPYSARGLYLQLWRKLDDDGRLDLGRYGLRGVCAHVGTPSDWPVIQPDLNLLIESGAVLFNEQTSTLELPDFKAAQGAYVCSPEAERKRKAREQERTKPDTGRTCPDASRTSHTEVEREEKRREEEAPEVAGKPSLDPRPPVEPVSLPDQPTSKPANLPPRSGPAPDATPRTRAREPEAVEPKQIALLSDADKRPAPPRQKRASDSEGKTTPVWLAYARAYQKRYGVEPVRNAKVSGQLAQMVAQIGVEKSMAVASYFPSHNKAYYVQRYHSVGVMVADAQGLLTEIETGRKVNAETARRNEKTDANEDVYAAVEARLFGNKSTEPEDIECRADDEGRR